MATVKETIPAKGIDIGIYSTNFENEFISTLKVVSLNDLPKLEASPQKN
ncbi:Uncharacterised protein [uncultured Eubacterium sp.]|nr:Uncharacterised protein [uncultured Eubacterium sp.]